MERTILCIDLKSFYATCECVKRGLDPYRTKLAVVANKEQKGSIVLAISPALKQVFPHSRCRVYELPLQYDIMKVQANMEYYVQKAKEVIAIYLEFISDEDLHVYSIDEAFLDISSYLTYYQCDAYTLAKRILARIQKKTQCIATCGISHNLLLAKLALDLESKTSKEGIAWWKEEDIQNKLWKVTPLSKMWGIGKKLEERLRFYHIQNVGELARCDQAFLVERFGVLGAQLHEHANGIDESRIQEKYQTKQRSLSSSQMLMRDYFEDEIFIIIKEQLEELCMRLRSEGMLCKGVRMALMYANHQGGMQRQIQLAQPSNSGKELYAAILSLLECGGEPIRQVSISLYQLSKDTHLQLSLFEERDQEDALGKVMDQIRNKYGKAKLFHAISLLPNATGKERIQKIGGHTR